MEGIEKEEISVVEKVLKLPGETRIVAITKGTDKEAKKRQEESLIEELKYMKDMEEVDVNDTKDQK